MRAIWKGSINFGLVYIPVSVYPATKEEKISFRQLRASDLSPIRYKKVAEADQKEVPADQIVKGFEYEKGKWVTLVMKTSRRCRSNRPTRLRSRILLSRSRLIRSFFTNPIFSNHKRAERKRTPCSTRR